jgi:sugar phosphate isomerase/epimerase
MKTLVQLYSARNFTPWDRILDQVKSSAYDGVEGFFANYEDPAAFRRLLDERGLIMPQGHFGLDLLESNFEKAISIARTLGIDTVIAPWLAPEDRPADLAGWKILAARLDLLDHKVRGEGFDFAWHNHDFEFVPVENGLIPMDILLDAAPEMNWEADLGWILRAGGDPLDWLRARAERVVAVHLKDVQPNHATALEDGWADLGHGVSDWRPIFEEFEKLPYLKAHVAEHDNPVDLDRFLRRWSQSFKTLASQT